VEDNGQTPLHVAIQKKVLPNLEVLRVLLGAGVKPSAANAWSSTPLIAASDFGYYDAVALMLQYVSGTQATVTLRG